MTCQAFKVKAGSNDHISNLYEEKGEKKKKKNANFAVVLMDRFNLKQRLHFCVTSAPLLFA